ncbi:hypothetical protein VD0002_g7574 [Verticillium dahliae]|uniref:Uncharacterized protein n=1 Tax=Verticillium dahliae TaxID=27337 RepID=A0AA44WK32_VERDA|nr:hypothetical protein BJF96_g5477 [Verticillium dahliae]PNH53728.1 hypothetical protein VD0003_g3700 [Verticillium dahliae]PNH60020.1 hypothetical protein VD0002_g7574 [Verticillium dahliae]
MKTAYLIISVFFTVSFAAPNPAAVKDVVEDGLEKRQSFGCGACKNGKRFCWSCTSGGCSDRHENC